MFKGLTKLLSKVAYTAVKNKSTIELVAGGLCIVAGTVILIKDAGDIAMVNDDVAYDKAYKEEIDKCVKNSSVPTTWADEDNEGRTRMRYTLTKAAEHSLAYAKVCWKPLLLETAGLVLIGMSHADLTRQLQTVSAAAAAQAMSFAEYRKRVVADQGEQKDYEYLTGAIKTVEVKEDGTVVETTTPINDSDGVQYIPHAFFLDDTDMYTDNSQKNLENVERALNQVNSLLHRKGVLTENEIRRVFGCKCPTIAGQCGGAFAQNKDGSLNYISIGLESHDDATQRFLAGAEPNFLIRLQYTDGKPIETNIFADARVHELGWSRY